MQQRRVLRLERQRALQVVTRQALVVGQRRQRPLGPDAGIDQVDVVRARSRAVEAAELRIAARRAELDSGRHAPHLDWSARQHCEQIRQTRLDRLDLPVQVGEQLRTTGIGVRIEPARVLRQRRQTRADRALAVTLCPEQRIRFRCDFRDLRKAEFVRFVRREPRRGLVAQAQLVVQLAARATTHAGIMAGACALLGGRGDLRIERLGQRSVDQSRGSPTPVAGDALGGRTLDQRACHGRLRPRLCAQQLELHKSLVHDEVRRNDATPQVVAHAGCVVVQLAGKRLQPRQERLGIGG